MINQDEFEALAHWIGLDIETLEQDDDFILVTTDFYDYYHNDDYHEENDEFYVVKNYKSSFSSILSRTLHPVDWLNDSEESSSIPSLISLCCQEMTRNANYLEKVSTFLPINLFDLLLITAISKDFRESAAVLISNWPSKSISTSAIKSGIFGCYVTNNSDSVGLARKLIVLMKLFLNAIGNNSTSRLRVLDLRGIPISDAMVFLLLKRINNLSTDIKSRNEDYHIIIDCAINPDGAFRKLSLFLSMANLCGNKDNLHLHINSIDVTKLTETLCWTLLQAINPSDLVGLRVSVCFSTDFYEFVFTKFSLLKNLEFTCRPPWTSCDELFQLLLPDLRRFGITNAVPDIQSTVPKSILLQLDYLQIGGGHLIKRAIPTDIEYLTSIPLIISELSVREWVIFQEDLNVWEKFLRSLAATLVVLELVGCLMDSDLFPSLVNSITPLINLKYLNMYEQHVSLNVVNDYVPILCSLPNLKGGTLRCELDGNGHVWELGISAKNEQK